MVQKKKKERKNQTIEISFEGQLVEGVLINLEAWVVCEGKADMPGL